LNPQLAKLAPPIPSTSGVRQIEYLSPPAQVSMTDDYFQIASLEHFWVRRRFEVLQKLAGSLITEAKEMADVGCGHGILQRQVEEAYGREVTGFDLNENGLKHNLSRFSRVCCYDILQRKSVLKECFDLLFLCDVLEHIADEDGFLQSLLFHLAPVGKLVVNVPAGDWAFSGYDRAAGHVRRYSANSFLETARRNGLEVLRWTYWGLPLLPTLLFRKLWLSGNQEQSKAYSAGFDAGSQSVNGLLGFVSKFENIPQKIAGTSLTAVLQAKAMSSCK
jgi:SAM-dependent methyltransferase